MKKLTIEEPGSAGPNPKSKIQNPKLVLGVLAFLLATASLTATPKPTPTSTPTPHKLAGGFGRGAPATAVTPARPIVPGDGQSLGQVVRDARKPRGSRTPVSITNKTLVTDPKKGRLSTVSPRNPTPVPARVEETRAAGESPSAAAAPAESEVAWRERARLARHRVEELKDRIQQAELEVRKLEGDFYSWDDGQYRDGVIKPAWDRKRDELETARRELVTAERELSLLPEQARKAGVPQGWVRP